jgi:hypothetical protein
MTSLIHVGSRGLTDAIAKSNTNSSGRQDEGIVCVKK